MEKTSSTIQLTISCIDRNPILGGITRPARPKTQPVERALEVSQAAGIVAIPHALGEARTFKMILALPSEPSEDGNGSKVGQEL